MKRCLAVFCMICLLLGAGITGCGRKDSSAIRKNGFYLDTIITITLYDTEDESLLEDGMKLCASYENLFSKSKENSDIYKLNHSHGQPVQVSEETVFLIKQGLYYYELSDGLFDISIGSVSSLWDFTGENPKVPGDAEISDGLTFVDASAIEISGTAVTIPDGMQLDLGGIAKGYIGDKLAEFYRDKGIESALLNLGGNVICIGTPPDKEAFHIGIKKPFSENDTITSVYVKDACVVTSGIYERYFEKNDRLYHHILNPSTGYPAETDLYGVTIIGTNSMQADALSTICLMLGTEKGNAFIKEQTDVRAIFVTADEGVLEINGKQGQ